MSFLFFKMRNRKSSHLIYNFYISGNLGRVTGMDPALPLFSFDNPGGRLDKGDASYVDVIHTCGGWLGFERGLGHADFYPNGGSFAQPGCGSDVTGNKSMILNSN